MKMNIQTLARQYRERWVEAGQWQDPTLADCLDFMVTEVAEAIDKRLRMSGGYVRNSDKGRPGPVEVGREVFDAILMGCVALDLLGLDLETIARSKLEEMDKKRMGVAGDQATRATYAPLETELRREETDGATDHSGG